MLQRGSALNQITSQPILRIMDPDMAGRDQLMAYDSTDYDNLHGIGS